MIGPEAMARMIADYMEQGFLSNIVAMFKADPSLYDLTGTLLGDERMRVRMGVTALVEELYRWDPDQARRAVPSLLGLLQDPNPTIRGDAAYLVALAGTAADRAALGPLRRDPHPQVAALVRELLEEGHAD